MRKNSLEVFARFEQQFKEEKKIRCDYVSPDDQAYLKSQVYAQHPDSDSEDNNRTLPELEIGGRKMTAA